MFVCSQHITNHQKHNPMTTFLKDVDIFKNLNATIRNSWCLKNLQGKHLWVNSHVGIMKSWKKFKKWKNSRLEALHNSFSIKKKARVFRVLKCSTYGKKKCQGLQALGYSYFFNKRVGSIAPLIHYLTNQKNLPLKRCFFLHHEESQRPNALVCYNTWTEKNPRLVSLKCLLYYQEESQG